MTGMNRHQRRAAEKAQRKAEPPAKLQLPVPPSALAARKSAIEFNNEALRVVPTDKVSAYRLECSAVVVDPTMFAGWLGLGNALADMQMYEASAAAFRRLLELPVKPEAERISGDLTPDYRVKAMVNLGHRMMNAAQRAVDLDDALEVALAAVNELETNPDMDPDNKVFGVEGKAFAYLSVAMIYSLMLKDDLSLVYAQKAFKLSQEPIIETGLAFATLFSGDYATGLRHFDARFAYTRPMYLNYPYARWDGGHLDGTLFIECDQGLGDTISFARFVPLAAERCQKVVFRVYPELLRMMTAAMELWQNIEVIPFSTVFPIADVWCPIVSLPPALGLTTGQIATQSQHWKVPATQPPTQWKVPGRKIHIGIAWAGSPANLIDCYRSMKVTDFLALYRVPGVQLYSLQVGDRVRDLHDTGCAALIRDMSPYIRDAMDTAAIMRELDLVVTCESFVGHLAGAVNVPCWTLVSRLGGDWRCGRTSDTPLWYENTSLFRQGPDCRWVGVFDDVVQALTEW